MILVPNIICSNTDSVNYQAALRYCQVPFWEDGYASMFAENIVADFPYAPPGMLQHMSSFEFNAYRYWMRNTVRTWQTVGTPTILPTTDPKRIWMVRMCEATVFWGRRDCRYQNEFLTLLELRDGVITYIKEYANPISYYNALGIVLPAFLYDPVKESPSFRMGDGEKSVYTLEQNIKRAIANFTNPIEGIEGTESIYSSSVLEVCPYAPYSMTESYSGADFDVQSEWMLRVVPEWISTKKPSIYFLEDPNVILVDYEGYGETTWSGCKGHYHQREAQLVFLKDGKAEHFRVYFNPMNKFASMNQSVPTFPYFNF